MCIISDIYGVMLLNLQYSCPEFSKNDLKYKIIVLILRLVMKTKRLHIAAECVFNAEHMVAPASVSFHIAFSSVITTTTTTTTTPVGL